MKEIISEFLKKVNEKNIIYISITLIIWIGSTAISSNTFKNLTARLKDTGIPSPYSVILTTLLYLGFSIIFAKLIFMAIYKFNNWFKFHRQTKLIKNLPEEEFILLLHFALFQDRSHRFKAEDVHKVRILKTKGFVSTGWNNRYGNGDETFFISDNLLNYLTTEYASTLEKFRNPK